MSWLSGNMPSLKLGSLTGGGGNSMMQRQADEAKQWSEGFLGTGDDGFKHSRDPIQDGGHFKVSDVRPRPKQGDRGASRLVRLPKGNYEEPPKTAKGLKSCDLNHKAQDHFKQQSIDLETAVFADNNRIISPLIQAWRSDENTHLIYDAEMVWIEAQPDARDCIFFESTFDLSKKEQQQEIKYPQPAKKGVEYEVISWLKGFRFTTDNKDDFALDFWPSKITPKGFTANASGSSNCERLAASWIVYRKDKDKVASGSFGTDDAEDRKENAPEAKGWVEFPNGKFETTPTVLASLSQFDLAGGRDLRIGVEVTDVSVDGFAWKIHTWGADAKDALHSAEATWIALGFV